MTSVRAAMVFAVNIGWCHFHFCFILLLRTNKGEIGQCGSV